MYGLPAICNNLRSRLSLIITSMNSTLVNIKSNLNINIQQPLRSVRTMASKLSLARHK